MSTYPEVAIVGCGFIGRIYAEVLAELGVEFGAEYGVERGLRVAAVVDSDEAARTAVAESLGCRAYATQAEMLSAEPGVVAVGIATPSQFHAELTREALRAGRHVLCEKPLALTLAEVEEMVAIAREADRKLAVGFKMRFEGMFMELSRLVDVGVVGPVRRVVISQHQPVPPQAWARRHGIVNELLIHSIDAVNWFMGEAPTSLEHESRADRAVISLGFGGERDGLITGAWVEGFPQLGGSNDMLVQVVGRDGHLIGIRPDTVIVNTSKEARTIDLPASRYADAFKREWRAFLAWLAGDEDTDIACMADGLRVHRIIDYIERTSEKREAFKHE